MVALALAITALVLLLVRRRIPWALVAAGLIVVAGQLFATVVLYASRPTVWQSAR